MFNEYPYTDFHEMNTDWIISKIKNVETAEANTTQYAEDADAAKTIAVDAKDTAVEAKDDAVEAKDDAISFLTDTKDQLDLLQARVDNIIPDGTQTAGNLELLDIRVGYDGTSYPSAGDAVRGQVGSIETVLDTTATYRNISNTDYNRTLSEVSVSCVTAVISSSWDDLPSGITGGTFFNYIYSSTYAVQFILSYPDRRLFSRIVQYTDGTVLRNWMEYCNEDTIDDYMLFNAPSAGDYNNLVGKVTTKGYLNVASSAGWTDLPISSFNGIIANYPYSSTGCVQIAYPYQGTSSSIYMRYVNPSTGAEYGDGWHQVDGFQISRMQSTLDPNDYSGLLSNIDDNIKIGFSSSTGWTDFPNNESVGSFYTIQYAPSKARLQIFVSYPDEFIYIRTVIGTTVYTPWIPFAGGNCDVVYYALGDSITSGSYSTPDGQSVVATNAEWAYPNRIGRKYGCKVHNLGVPGSAITELAGQVALVGSDATLVTITGGANDYYARTNPLGDRSSAVDYTTVCGAIKSAIESITAAAPNARIVLMSPFIIKQGSEGTKWSMNYAITAQGNFTYADLADAMRDIAEDYNIDFIDGTRQGPVNIKNIGDVLKDDIHPTQVFYNAISNFVGSRLF